MNAGKEIPETRGVAEQDWGVSRMGRIAASEGLDKRKKGNMVTLRECKKKLAAKGTPQGVKRKKGLGRFGRQR